MKEKKKSARLWFKQNIFSQIPFHCFFAVLFLCLFLFGLGAGHTAEITLSWDKNTETDLAGYKVFSGTSSGNYASSIDVGNWNSCTVSGLQEGKTYYYAAKAYNTAGLVSGYSNEVSYNTPVTPVSYTLTASSGSNGSISPSGTVPVSSGTSQTFIIIPNYGYKVTSVAVDGAGIGTPTSYTFSNVTANHSIHVQFTPVSYTLTASSGSNGSISPSGTISVSSGGSQTFTMTPDNGYKVASVEVDGVNAGTETSYTFSNVTANHSINVQFTPLIYTLTASSGSNGSISPSGTVSVPSGGSQTFTMTPDNGYKVASVEVDGVNAGTPTSYTFSNVTANHSIHVQFTPLSYTLTASSGSNGSISPSGAVAVSYSTSQTFTITPANGYVVASVKVDGVNAGTPTSYTFNNVTANHSIEVTFAAAVTSNVPVNYTICGSENQFCSFSGTKNVAYGANGKFAYKTAIDGISCNNSTFGDPIVGVVKACYIAPEGSYTLRASSGSNGSISPSGTVSVSSGGSQTFTMTPDNGYKVASVEVDGVNVGTPGSYTFNNVTANHSIEVTFAAAVTPNVPVNYTLCASENQFCSFSGTKNVAYGANGKFAYKTAIDGISCNNSTFGDPIVGVVKACYVK